MIGNRTDEEIGQDQEDAIEADNFCYDARQADPTVTEETLLSGMMEKYGWDKERAADMLRQALHPVNW